MVVDVSEDFGAFVFRVKQSKSKVFVGYQQFIAGTIPLFINQNKGMIFLRTFQTALPTRCFISDQIMPSILGHFFISLIGYIIDGIIFHGKSYRNISTSVDYKHHVISWEIKHY
jgi:hypothetical protein